MTGSGPSDYCAASSEDQEMDTLAAGFTDQNICGEGATCVVYQMRLNGLRVAVKRLRGKYVSDPRHRAAYRKEFQIGQQLKHAALPVYRQLRDDIDEVFIIMDFIDGISLQDFLEQEDGKEYFSSADNTRRLLSELLNVTGYLHRHGVIHCDLKPANIMLRYSDRGLMLLDLDKSYCDILDRTHGGTPHNSEPLSAGENPTVQKDFKAIGNILDDIAFKVPNFPPRKFKQFRNECRNPETSDEKLSHTLHRRPNKRLWITGVMIAVFLGSFAVYKLTYRPPIPATTPLDQEVTETVTDSIGIVDPEPAPPEPSHSHPLVETESIDIDFDSGMAEFIRQVEASTVILSSGSARDDQIRDMISAILESYTSKYGELLSDLKEKNPDISGIDIEMAVARESERSRAANLYQHFIQAAGDTIKARRSTSLTEE